MMNLWRVTACLLFLGVAGARASVSVQFTANEQDLQYTQLSLTKPLPSGTTVKFSSGDNISCLGYDVSYGFGGIYAYNAMSSSGNGTQLTLTASTPGQTFSLQSVDMWAYLGTLSVSWKHLDGTDSSATYSVSTGRQITVALSASLENIQQVTLTSDDYAVFQNFVFSFPPLGTTGSASSVDSVQATVAGTVDANGLSTSDTVQYGTTTSYGATMAATPAPITGFGATKITATLSGLLPGTTYHYRIKAVNADGISYGADSTFTTSKLSQTIAFGALPSQTYGTASVKLTATASSGLAVSYVSSNPAAVRISNDTAYLLAADTATITASQPGSASYLAASSVSRKLTIAKKGLTIADAVAVSRTYDGTTAASVSGATLSGVANSDDVSLTLGTAAFATKDTGTAKAVTVTGSALSGTKAGNYSLTEVTGLRASITAKPLHIVGVTATDKVYDGTPAATLAGGTLDSVLTGDVVTLTSGTGSFADKKVGVSKIVTATGYSLSGTDAGNYALSAQPTGLAASITAYPITVSAVAASKTVGTADPVFAYTAGALFDGDSWSGTLARDPGESVGAYVIRQGTLAVDSNYAITYDSALFTIVAATGIERKMPQGLPKVRDLGLFAVGTLPRRAIGFGRAELGLSQSSDESSQSVSVLLPDAGAIRVDIFDLLGTPVLSWNQTVDSSLLATLEAAADGRHIATLSWNLRAANGVAVPAGVYLWKIEVTTANGQKLETVQKLGVK